MTLEKEIYSIETANINKETLEAMKNASKAMKEIHGGLTIEKVDQTMYVLGLVWRIHISTLITLNREELRDQHAIVEEIGEAITQSVGAQGMDESELDEELEALQQEELDSQMLGTGQVPIHDKISAMPSAPQTGKSMMDSPQRTCINMSKVNKGKAPVVQEDEEEEELRKLQG